MVKRKKGEFNLSKINLYEFSLCGCSLPWREEKDIDLTHYSISQNGKHAISNILHAYKHLYITKCTRAEYRKYYSD